MPWRERRPAAAARPSRAWLGNLNFSRYDVYVADYILDFSDPKLQTPIKGLKDDYSRIRKLLSDKAPEALKSYDDFFAAVNMSGSIMDIPFQNTSSRVWNHLTTTLTPIQYGDYIHLLPSNLSITGNP